MRYSFWTAMLLYVALVAVDMRLTSQYIGDDWTFETCLPMSIMIKECGIGRAVWYSRVICCIFFFVMILLRNCWLAQCGMCCFVLFYLIAMTDWLFFLGYLYMP